MDRRQFCVGDESSGSNGETSRGYDNHGYRLEARDQKQWLRNEIPLNVFNAQQQHEHDQFRTLYDNNRDLRRTMASNLRHASLHNQHVKNRKSTINKCLIAFFFILLVATIIPVCFIYYQYDKLKEKSCTPHLHTDPPPVRKEQQISEDSLKALKNRIANLTDELKQFMTSTSINKCPARNTREDRRRYSQLSRRATSVEQNINRTAKSMKVKISNIDGEITKMKNSIEELQSQISDKNQTKDIAGKCVFKVQSKSAENVPENVSVTITQLKGDEKMILGIACCNNNSSQIIEPGILSATETITNITYTCCCRDQRVCHLCYWHCTVS